MSDEYTPSTEDVAGAWSRYRATWHGVLRGAVSGSEFDRWLAAHDAETVRVTAEKAAALGYVVLAKRPDIHRPGEFEYQPAGGVHATIEPCENHQAYCQDSAEADRERYGDVEYVIGRIALAPPEEPS